MNLQLLPYSTDIPESVDIVLDEGIATCCRFNRWGTLLATGCHDGRVVVWDFDTLVAAQVLLGHAHPITSLSWSRSGKKLASACTDHTVCVWDVLSGSVDARVRFESPVWSVQFHPRDQTRFLASPVAEARTLPDPCPAPPRAQHALPRQPPVLVRLERHGEGPTEEWTSTRTQILVPAEAAAGSSAAGGVMTPVSEEEAQQAVAAHKKMGLQALASQASGSAAAFDRKGEHIYCGTARGAVVVLATDTLAVVRSTPHACGAAAKAIEFSRNGKRLLVNGSDRVIRCYDSAELHLIGEYQDSVSKVPWKKCLFSSNNDFIVGGSTSKMRHMIYIWTLAGTVEKMLEGPREGVMDLAWHPTRPILISAGTCGTVFVWGAAQTENWSAYAPKFKEIEENEVYVEREDEFDAPDEEDEAPAAPAPGGASAGAAEPPKKKKRKVAEDDYEGEVDVVTVEPVRAYCSCSEDETESALPPEEDPEVLMFLPSAPERDPVPPKQN
eukprot:m51a1_g3374 hypothetical protein (498) ;mRNA; f:467874-469491